MSQKGFSTGFTLGYIKDIPLNTRRNFGLGIGLGISTNSYNNNLKISKSNGAYNYELIDLEDSSNGSPIDDFSLNDGNETVRPLLDDLGEDKGGNGFINTEKTTKQSQSPNKTNDVIEVRETLLPSNFTQNEEVSLSEEMFKSKFKNFKSFSSKDIEFILNYSRGKETKLASRNQEKLSDKIILMLSEITHYLFF